MEQNNQPNNSNMEENVTQPEDEKSLNDSGMEEPSQVQSDLDDMEIVELKNIDLQSLAKEWDNKDPTTILAEQIEIIAWAYIKKHRMLI